MRFIFLLLPALAFAQMQHLSPEEVAAAVAAKPNSGFVNIQDAGFTTPSLCQAQMPSVSIFTPSGWLNARSLNAKQQFLAFTPTDEDTMRALTILANGCANGTPAGPVCESITRVALLSDRHGSRVAEAITNGSIAQKWQNGYGASAACSSLVSRFALADVQKVRNRDGTFFVATFNGAQLLKVYEVKEKHLKKLGLP